ncbi:MAG: hypothetical protein KGL39_39360 [Patescibacteria group bacterium]|nr:hypothetical protein [Patescibacteria group bacterium]
MNEPWDCKDLHHPVHRTCRAAFGTDFEPEDLMGEDTPTGAVVLWLAMVIAVVVLIVFVYFRKENGDGFAQAPDQQRIVIEQHYQDGGMK